MSDSVPQVPTGRSPYTPIPRPPRRRMGRGRLALIALVLASIFALLVTVVALGSGFDRTAGGEVAVVRNGGPFDNNKVRQVIQPASARIWTGLFSTSHKYPAQQRFYTITANPSGGDRTGVDVENDPTADGVEVGIEGTVYFTLTSEPAALKTFDDKYGTRKYQGLDKEFRYAWSGDAGWSTFLDQIIRPVISNDLREEIGNFNCAELQASCALVQNGQNASATTGSAATGAAATKNNVNIRAIQDAINTSLSADLKTTLGGSFITGVQFNLAKITLPTKVQDAINSAQAAFAAVSEAQAKVAQATAEANANTQRQRGYATCPACVTIDTLKAIPPTVTTFAPGSGFAITATGK